MSRLKSLRQKKADNLKRGDEILAAAEEGEGREFTDEERTELDALTAARATLNEDIVRAEALLDEERHAPAVESMSAPPPPGKAVVDPTDAQHNREQDKPWGETSAEKFGNFLLAVMHSKMTGVTDPRLFAAAQGMGEAIGEDGGFLVGTDMMIDLTKEIQTGKILSRLKPIPLKPGSNGITIKVIDETSRATGSRWGAVQAYWVDEGGAGTASRPKLAEVDLKLRKVMALGYDTNELEQDASAGAMLMTTAFADELRFEIENAIFRGTGAGQPSGFLTAPATIAVPKETGQAANTITTANLSAMWARFSGRNPVWQINRDVGPQLDILSIPAGTGALEPRFVTYGPDSVMRIKGAPVEEVEYASTLGTKGDISLVDYSGYGYIDGGGVKQAASMHVAFTTDEMAFRATMRVDGQVLPRAALTPFKGSDTISPFVTLATRA